MLENIENQEGEPLAQDTRERTNRSRRRIIIKMLRERTYRASRRRSRKQDARKPTKSRGGADSKMLENAHKVKRLSY